MTRMPVAIVGVPGIEALMRPTSPGAMPVAERNIRWPFGQKSPKRAFQTWMTSSGVTCDPTCTVNVFWNRRPKPPFAAFRRRPRTFALIAPSRSVASRFFTGFAQLPSSRVIAVLRYAFPLSSPLRVALRLHRRERVGLAVVDRDRLVEPGELEDLLVVVVQAGRADEPSVLACTGEDPDDERDPGARQEVDPGEVEQHGLRPVRRRRRVRVVERVLGRGIDLRRQVHDRRPVLVPNRLLCGHWSAPFSPSRMTSSTV